MQPIEHRKLSSPEAAEYLGINAYTLPKWRVFGGGPVYRKVGRRVIYDTRDLEAWLDAHRCKSTSDAPAAHRISPSRSKNRRRRVG
jgi:hypothetical protein